MLSKITNLDGLWDYVNDLNKRYFPSSRLAPIVGNGKTISPRFMFVFINPTVRNISSNISWKGPRFPFIGTKQVWRVFHRADLFDGHLMEEINKNSDWSVEFANEVLEFLQRQDFYLTNIVKWTGQDATLPDADKICLFLPVLKKEIELVKPRYIVTFGLIPFEKLTKQKIRLSDYYTSVKKKGKLSIYELRIASTDSKIIPCYFPVGRGDPNKAVEILSLLNKLE